MDSVDGGPITRGSGCCCGVEGASSVEFGVPGTLLLLLLIPSVEPRGPLLPAGPSLSPLAELVDPDFRRSLLHHFQSGCALKCASFTCYSFHERPQ